MLNEDHLDAVFHALANKTRRSLLAQLAKHPASVTQLAQPYEMSLNAVSKHLMVLERAGLIDRAKSDGGQTCRLSAEPLSSAETWISSYQSFWTEKLDDLAKFVEQREGKG